MQWEDVGFIKASQIRLNIIFLLSNRAMTPKEIQVHLALHFPQVSRALRELQQRGLVQCITDDLKKGRLYVLSEKGIEVITTLKNLERK